MKGRALRFALVGLSGVLVNLATLHALAGVLGVPEVAASALAIEASILGNFFLNDALTFPDRRSARGTLHRLARYHVVALAGGAIQLATFVLVAVALSRGLGLAELGRWRSAAQLSGIGVAFVVSYTGSARFAWAPGAPALGGPAPRIADRLARVQLAPAIFAALIVLHVLPIWLVRYFPTQDGPLHVENVLALLRVGHSALLQRWYAPNLGAQPNWLTQALLVPLLAVAPALVAEKIVLTGYTILFPLAFRAALPRGRRGWWAALAAFPFVHAFPFQMGFWNFCYGVALVLLTVAFWARTRGRLDPPRAAGLSALGLILFLAHATAFGAAVVIAGTLLAWRAALALRRARGSPARTARVARAYAGRAAGALVAVLPGLVLLTVWTLRHAGQRSSRLPPFELAAKLAAAYALVSIDRREIVLAACVSAVLAIAVLHLVLVRASRRARLRPQDGWLAAAAAFAALYFALPDVVAAGAYVSDRMALLALVSAALWIGAGAAAPAVAVRRVSFALAAIAVAALALRFEKQRELSSYVEEYVSAASHVGAHRVLLPIAVEPYGPRDENGRRLGYRVKPFLHATGWVIASNGGVDLKNSQAHTDQCPVRFRGSDPLLWLAGSVGMMEDAPPCANLFVVSALKPDYLLVWGMSDEALATPCGAALSAGLEGEFVRVFRSSPRGMLEIWRPRARTATASR